MSMEPKTIAFAQVSIAANAITSSRRYNCTVGRNGAGDYTLVIGGSGGADEQVCMVTVVPQTAAAGGAGTTRAPSVTNSSDVAKQIIFFDDANAAADPAGFWLEIKRYPPLPTP